VTLYSRQVQKTVNFTGIEEFLNQDACASESMGPIFDRTKEHLGASDSYVIQVRRFLLKALRDLQAGKQPPGLVYGSAKADFSASGATLLICRPRSLGGRSSRKKMFNRKKSEELQRRHATVQSSTHRPKRLLPRKSRTDNGADHAQEMGLSLR
jgi:hypothetical protein